MLYKQQTLSAVCLSHSHGIAWYKSCANYNPVALVNAARGDLK